MFVFLMIAVVVLVAFFHWLQGFFSSAISAVLAVFSAVIAVSYHETIVERFLGGGMADIAHAVVLVGMFAVIYSVLRTLFDKFVPGNVSLPALADRLGGGLMGLVAGCFTAGVLALAAQQMSFFPSVMGYARYPVERMREVTVPVMPKNLDRTVTDLLEPDNLYGQPQKMMLPVDDIVIDAVRHLSDGGSLASRPLTEVHPDWLQELFGQRLGIEPGARRVSLNLPAKGRREVIARAEPSDAPHADAGVYELQSVVQKEGEFGQLRFANKGPLPATFPAVKDPRGEKMLVVVRAYFTRDAADRGARRLIRLSPGAVRLVAQAPDATGQGLNPTNYYPTGTLDGARVMYAHKPDDFIFVNAEGDAGNPAIDLVFQVNRRGFVASGGDKDPAKQTVAPGTFLEVKRLAREDLSGATIRTRLAPSKAVAVLRKPLIEDPTGGKKPESGDPVLPPSVTSTPAPSSSPTPGQYRATRGKEGMPVFSEMTATLRADRSAEYSIVTELNGQRSTKGATGAWSEEGEAITVRLEKSLDGSPIPEDMRSMGFRKSPEGDLVPERDPSAVLKRIGDAPAAGSAPAAPTSTPPAPAEKPLPLSVVGAEPSTAFFAPVGAATTTPGTPTPIPGGSMLVHQGKIRLIDVLRPSDLTALRGTAAAVSDLYVPADKSMVRVQLKPSASTEPDDAAWREAVPTLSIVLADGGKAPIQGAWVVFEEGGAKRLVARYNADTGADPAAAAGAVSLRMVEVAARPTEVWAVFLVPKGATVQRVMLGDKVAGDLTPAVAVP